MNLTCPPPIAFGGVYMYIRTTTTTTTTTSTTSTCIYMYSIRRRRPDTVGLVRHVTWYVFLVLFLFYFFQIYHRKKEIRSQTCKKGK